MIAELRALAGDAVLAVGELIRGRLTAVDGWADPDYLLSGIGAMESDGPDLAKPIPVDEVRSALYDLPDSQLIGVAAAVIQGCAPVLPEATEAAVLVAALRDRQAQFEAVELDAAEPFLTPAHLGAHLR